MRLSPGWLLSLREPSPSRRARSVSRTLVVNTAGLVDLRVDRQLSTENVHQVGVPNHSRQPVHLLSFATLLAWCLVPPALSLVAGALSDAGSISGDASALLRDAMRANKRVTDLNAHCDPRVWGTPVPRRVGLSRAPVVATFPAIATSPRGELLFGNSIPFFDTRVIHPGSLTAISVADGQDIGAPAGPFSFAYPKAITTTTGQTRLFWVEPAQLSPALPAREWPLREFAWIWSATYTPGLGWSFPERVYGPRPLIWHHPSPAPISVRGADTPTLLLPVVSRPNAAGAFALLRLTDATWRVQPLPFPHNPAYATLVSVQDRLLLGYIAGNSQSRGRNVNSVFVAHSLDGGTTWSPPLLLGGGPGERAYEIKALVDAKGTAHLVWLHVTDAGHHSLRHTRSLDGGSTWSPASSQPLDGVVLNLDAALDHCDVLHVLFQTSTDRQTTVLVEAQWAGSWTTAQRLFPDLRTNGFVLAKQSSGHLLLAVLAQRNALPLHMPYEVYLASF